MIKLCPSLATTQLSINRLDNFLTQCTEWPQFMFQHFLLKSTYGQTSSALSHTNHAAAWRNCKWKTTLCTKDCQCQKGAFFTVSKHRHGCAVNAIASVVIYVEIT